MILIADSGSTKTSWCLVDQREKIWIDTEGYNPYYVDNHYICQSIKGSSLLAAAAQRVEAVYYYGAGCSPEKKHIVQRALQSVFQSARISVESDLLAAARALLGKETGFAAILGTGTNTCMYDGAMIAENVDSLGYMLGDEGSGSYLVKRLIRDFIRESMPEDIHADFVNTYRTTSAEILNNIYSSPLPNRYCASFSKFLGAHLDRKYVQNLVRNSFRDFFENLVSCYPNYRNHAFNACGSVAFYFQHTLLEVAREFGMRAGTIIAAPLHNL